MFGHRLGLHVICFPSGRWGYVGSIPTALGTEVPATRADVMGCRSHINDAGDLVAWKFPTFDTETEARTFAADKGCPVS